MKTLIQIKQIGYRLNVLKVIGFTPKYDKRPSGFFCLFVVVIVFVVVVVLGGAGFRFCFFLDFVDKKMICSGILGLIEVLVEI